MRDKLLASAQQSAPSTGGLPSMIIDAPPVVNTKPLWQKFDDPRPYVTVSGIAMDLRGKFLLLHRSDKVRSAKNCWSLPSGLHEVGLTMQEQFAQELREELNLEPIVDRHAMIGSYENILPNETPLGGWHWVIHVMAMRVVTLESLENREPDKHDKVLQAHILQDWISGREWAPKLGEFLRVRRKHIAEVCKSIL